MPPVRPGVLISSLTLASITDPETRIIAISLVGYGLLSFLSPPVAVAVAWFIFVATAGLVLARLMCLGWRGAIPQRAADPGTPFISIQVATHAEPPELVIKTLNTLARLDYPCYEVLVIDNNTSLASLYGPVRDHCERLGQRFRFFHFDDVQGAKAGALNLGLELCDQRTDTFLILDADYCVAPNLLREGVSYFSRPDIALVQFPQAYRNVSESCGLTWEYQHFFNVYMNAANRANTVLSTGTVSFLKREALVAIGGWPCKTLTEDAELGLRLQRRHLRVVYVSQVVSRGLMPTDLKSLSSQRRRWVLGNAQSVRAVLRSKKITILGKAMMLLQLTAWWNPLLVCGVILGVGTFLDGFAPGPHSGQILLASAGATAVYLVGTCLFLVLAVTRHGGAPLIGLKSFLIHLGLFWPGAIAWGELWVNGDKRFVRTNKFLAKSEVSGATTPLLVSMLLVVAASAVAPTTPALAFFSLVAALLLCGRAALLTTLHQLRGRTLSLTRSEDRFGAEVHVGTLQSPGHPRALHVSGPVRVTSELRRRRRLACAVRSRPPSLDPVSESS